MCKCVTSWSEDREAEGVHNSVPHTCSEYIAALESLIESGCADNVALRNLQSSFGRLPKQKILKGRLF